MLSSLQRGTGIDICSRKGNLPDADFECVFGSSNSTYDNLAASLRSLYGSGISISNNQFRSVPEPQCEGGAYVHRTTEVRGRIGGATTMDSMSRKRTRHLAALITIVGVTTATAWPVGATVSTGGQEIRWFESQGPYQGNPDDPSIDKPQVLDPNLSATYIFGDPPDCRVVIRLHGTEISLWLPWRVFTRTSGFFRMGVR